MVKPETAALCTEDALDLLDKMLVYDHVWNWLMQGGEDYAEGGHGASVFRSDSEEVNDL
jgi:hypothetical protein